MLRLNLWSSLAIGLVVLVTIPVLARFHVAFTSGTRPNAQAAPLRALAAGSATAVEWPFFCQGIATVHAVKPGGIQIPPPKNLTSEEAAARSEPRQRILYVQADTADLGEVAGIIRDTRVKQTCRIGSGELYTAAGDAIRLALKMKAEADSSRLEGTYQIFGGTGRFQQVRGAGSVVVAANGDKTPAETAMLTLSGTISY